MFRLVHRLRWLVLVVLLAALGGCSAEPPFSRIVSFGDSLSDVGSYRPAAAAFGGGRFTVNGAGPRIWTEWLAADLELTIAPALSGGVTLTTPQFAVFPVVAGNGDSWAQGGARVDAPAVSLTPGVQLAALSVRQQVDHFLAGPVASASGSLFLLNGGGNDIGFLGQAVLAGAISPDQARAGVVAAAQQMAAQARRLQALGPVVLLNQADGAQSPVAAASAPVRALYQDLTPRFNTALAAALEGSSVMVVDQFTFSRRVVADPAAFGLNNVTDPACALDRLPIRSAIVCSDATLVAAGAAQTSLWADTLHTTPAYHRHLATQVLAVLRAAGRL